MFSQPFTHESILLREICNGMITISGVFLLALFCHYAYRAGSIKRLVSDPVYQSALALIILIGGHVVRSFAAWMQFIWMDADVDADFWANSSEIFVAATVLIIIGKQLMIAIFSSDGWRLPLSLCAIIATITIPVAVAVIMSHF
jgi:hypothetical protein